MREKIARFMAGRYGNDQLNRFLLVLCAFFMLFAALTKSSVGLLLWFFSLALIVLTYYRILSRDIARRSTENAKYLRLCNKLKNKLRVLKERWVQRRDYKFFTCPSCHTTLRVPKGKGKINIVCRKCGTSFQRKT